MVWSALFVCTYTCIISCAYIVCAISRFRHSELTPCDRQLHVRSIHTLCSYIKLKYMQVYRKTAAGSHVQCYFLC